MIAESLTPKPGIRVHNQHISEVTNEASDFRLGGQSRLDTSVARTAAFDPLLPFGNRFCSDAQQRSRANGVIQSGVRVHPGCSVPEHVSRPAQLPTKFVGDRAGLMNAYISY